MYILYRARARPTYNADDEYAWHKTYKNNNENNKLFEKVQHEYIFGVIAFILIRIRFRCEIKGERQGVEYREREKAI